MKLWDEELQDDFPVILLQKQGGVRAEETQFEIDRVLAIAVVGEDNSLDLVNDHPMHHGANSHIDEGKSARQQWYESYSILPKVFLLSPFLKSITPPGWNST